MKAERRHELHENELAQALARVRVYVETHGKRLLLIVAGAVALIVIISMVIRSSAESRARDWAKYSDLLSGATETDMEQVLSGLLDLAETTADQALAVCCLGRSGELALSLAVSAENDEDARKYTDQAERAFKQILNRFSRYPMARGVALCGLATVAENRFALTGDASLKNSARENLERVSNDPELNATPMQSQAITRLAMLDELFRPTLFAPAPPDEPVGNEVTITPGRRPLITSPPAVTPPEATSPAEESAPSP